MKTTTTTTTTIVTANMNAGSAASVAGLEYERTVAERISKFTLYDRTQRARTIQLPRPALTYIDQAIIADAWMPELRTFVQVKGGDKDTIGSLFEKWYHQLSLIDEGIYLRALDGGLFPDAPCGFLLVLAGSASEMIHVPRFLSAWDRHTKLYPREYRYAWCVRERDITQKLLQTIQKTVASGATTA